MRVDFQLVNFVSSLIVNMALTQRGRLLVSMATKDNLENKQFLTGSRKCIGKSKNENPAKLELSNNQKTHDWIYNTNFDDCSEHSNFEIFDDNKNDLKSHIEETYAIIPHETVYENNTNYCDSNRDNLECSFPTKITILQNVRIDPVIKISNIEQSHKCPCSVISDSVSLPDDKESELFIQDKIILENTVHSPSEYKTENIEFKDIPPNIKNNFETDDYKSNSNSLEDDDSRDKDFKISEYSSDTTTNSSKSDTENNATDIHITSEPFCRPTFCPISERIKSENKKTKKIRCKYCDEDIDTKNFNRHLQRKHLNEIEVHDIMQYPKNSKERKQALAFLRNGTNFDLYIKGTIRPNREQNISSNEAVESNQYYPCSYCKGLFLKKYLRRHAKKCFGYKIHSNQGSKTNHLSRSQTITACAVDPTNVISKLNVKEQVYDIMKPDNISFEAKKDLLIAYFGNSYLKKHKRERMAYACSTRMRELARLLLAYRKIINNDNVCLKDLLHPKLFDRVVCAVRNIVGYDHVKKTFKSPSLAMHLGTSLKIVCDEYQHLVLMDIDGFKYQSMEERKIILDDLKHFKKLIESRWNIELGALANKDLQEKRWSKPLLMPLVRDIKKFRNETLNIANNCKQLFDNHEDNRNTYKELVNCTLALLIVFNRRRIGDVQFLKLKDYAVDNKTDFTDFESVLTETEKMLTQKYKRVINSGKGSRAVVILVPEIIQSFIKVLLENRSKYIPPDNEYVFATPGSRIKWGKGDVAIRTLSKKIKLENPQTISSNKLRKQIATIMQLLHLSNDETKQFSDFMGHNLKTHQQFYELPVDIFQTGKVSKILLMAEKGCVPAEYKGKSLSEINLDSNFEFVEENDSDDNNGNTNLNKEKTSHTISNNDMSYQKKKENIQDKAETEETIHENQSDEDTQRFQKGGKKRWSTNQITLLEKRFKFHIQKNQYPSGKEISEFIQKHKFNRSVPIVKSKLQHLMKLHKK